MKLLGDLSTTSNSSLKGELQNNNLLNLEGFIENGNSELSGCITTENEVNSSLGPNYLCLYGEINSGNNLSLYGNLFQDSIEINGEIHGNLLRGLSAYQIAVLHGFKGSEQEWLDSLHGGDAKDYTHLYNLPQLNGNVIIGNKQLLDFGIRTVSNEEIEEMFK